MTEKDRVRKLQSWLIKAAAGKEHERLRTDLNGWAAKLGYTRVLRTLPNGAIPDALRADRGGRFVFLGDAKNARTETASHEMTAQRITGYVREYARLIGTDEIDGGTFAIATNTVAAATEWKVALDWMFRFEGIVDGDGHSAAFSIATLSNSRTYIIHW